MIHKMKMEEIVPKTLLLDFDNPFTHRCGCVMYLLATTLRFANNVTTIDLFFYMVSHILI